MLGRNGMTKALSAHLRVIGIAVEGEAIMPWRRLRGGGSLGIIGQVNGDLYVDAVVATTRETCLTSAAYLSQIRPHLSFSNWRHSASWRALERVP